MNIINYKLEAYLPFEESEIESYLDMCEKAIYMMTDNDITIFKLKSATHELVTNSLEHGYKKNAGVVSFSLQKNSSSISLEVSDHGLGINFETIKQNDVSDFDSISQRGWGLLIIRKLSENMQVLTNNPSGTKICVEFST